MKSIYRPLHPYKTPGNRPWITYVFEYHERLDHAGEDSKAGIMAAMAQRSRPAIDNSEIMQRIDGLERTVKAYMQSQADRRPDRSLGRYVGDTDSEYDEELAWDGRMSTGSPLQDYRARPSKRAKAEY